MAPTKGKVLAIDYGEKMIGLASGELEFRIAFPRAVLLNRGLAKLVSEISAIVQEENVQLIVIGLPLNMEEGQSENLLTLQIKNFVAALQEALPTITIELVDERLSTFEASKYRADLKKGDRLDSHAAMVILNRYFSSSI